MVSKWPWSHLVQIHFQRKQPGPAKDYPPHRESSTKCAHRGWLCIAQEVTIYQSYNPAENIGKQDRISENIYGTSKNIWYHPEKNWGPIIDNLVQCDEDFNTHTEMWYRGGWVDGYLTPIPRSPDGDKKKVFCLDHEKNATNFNFCIT